MRNQDKVMSEIQNILAIYEEKSKLSFLIEDKGAIFSSKKEVDRVPNDFQMGFSVGEYRIYVQPKEEAVTEIVLSLLERELEKLLDKSLIKLERFWEMMLTADYDQDQYLSLLKSYGISEKPYYLWYFRGDRLQSEEFVEVMKAIWGNCLKYQFVFNYESCLFVIEESDDLSLEDGASLVIEEISAQLVSKFHLFVSQRLKSYRDIATEVSYLPRIAKLYHQFYPNKLIGFEDGFEMGYLFKYLDSEDEGAFIQRVLGKDGLSLLKSGEDMSTLYHFFRNNLSIADTARSLYIHRNTLSYRLDKLSERLGRDIRRFEEAALVYMALMLIQSE